MYNRDTHRHNSVKRVLNTNLTQKLDVKFKLKRLFHRTFLPYTKHSITKDNIVRLMFELEKYDICTRVFRKLFTCQKKSRKGM